jgi:uncharacterized membrane protein
LRIDLLGLIGMAAVLAYLCRAAGFMLMRFVPNAPRVESALSAAPMAVMIGIIVPAAMRGGPAEWIGLAAVGLAMRLIRNDAMAALIGMAAVALARAALR